MVRPLKRENILITISAALILSTILLEVGGAKGVLIFATSALAILPLAYFMGLATEELGKHSGPGLGGLLNATFGNATELIIALSAIRAGPALFPIIKASLTGSIIGNVLLVLGLSMLFGGIRFRKQVFSREVAGTRSTMLALAVIALVMPSLYAFSVQSDDGEPALLGPLSLWISLILLLAYLFGLVFSLHTHKDIFNPMEEGERANWTRKKALLILIGSAIFVALESEFLVGSIESSIQYLNLNELFIGVIVIAIIGNAAEHGTAIIMAWKNKMDLSVGIATNSSIQIALFVAPILVFASSLTGNQMNLAFEIFELIAIALSVVIVSMVSSDGESNWYEGAMLIMVYAILAIGFFFHP